ncbi:MAG: alpha/beta fold hydrolase [Acidobacteriota bacterium]
MSKTPESESEQTWLVFPRRNLQARLRLFCFPYAGGAASVFRQWAEGAPQEIEVVAIQLPGRENRWREPAVASMCEVIEPLRESILPCLGLPFAFFGHSLGALVAFELARLLHRRSDPQPIQLFVSGRRAPQLPPRRPPVHALPDAELVDFLRRLNGIPQEILGNQEVMSLFLPVIRADFSVNETYSYAAEQTLECPIWAFGGLEDSEVDRESLEAWDRHTAASFSVRMFPGDHFYLHANRTPLTRLIFHRLLASLRR